MPKGVAVAQFGLLPPRGRWWSGGAVVSLVVHGAAVLPLVISHSIDAVRNDPVEQLVVFLVPPNRDLGRESSGRGVDWSGMVGDRGAVEKPLPHEERPQERLPLGTAGDTATTKEAPSGQPKDETALTEIEVDSAVIRDPTSAAPIYPPELLAQSVEGSTFVHYVVDTAGLVDTTTIQVISTSHPAFALSVREALAHMKFRPAIQASHRVRQWVQQNFAFKIVKPRPPASDST